MYGLCGRLKKERSGLFPVTNDELLEFDEKESNALLKSVNEESGPFGINSSHMGSYSESVESSIRTKSLHGNS